MKLKMICVIGITLCYQRLIAAEPREGSIELAPTSEANFATQEAQRTQDKLANITLRIQFIENKRANKEEVQAQEFIKLAQDLEIYNGSDFLSFQEKAAFYYKQSNNPKEALRIYLKLFKLCLKKEKIKQALYYLKEFYLAKSDSRSKIRGSHYRSLRFFLHNQTPETNYHDLEKSLTTESKNTGSAVIYRKQVFCRVLCLLLTDNLEEAKELRKKYIFKRLDEGKNLIKLIEEFEKNKTKIKNEIIKELVSKIHEIIFHEDFYRDLLLQ